MRMRSALALSTILVSLLAGCHQVGDAEPDDSDSTLHTADPSEDPNYWTDERMRSATPDPMPSP